MPGFMRISKGFLDRFLIGVPKYSYGYVEPVLYSARVLLAFCCEASSADIVGPLGYIPISVCRKRHGRSGLAA